MTKTPSIYVVLVEPVGGVNLGLIARLIMNFDAKGLKVVNPKYDETQLEIAYRFSARAQQVIDNIEVHSSLKDAIKDMDITFATSAIISDEPIRKHLTPVEAAELVYRSGYNKVAIVFGREATGLTNEEIAMCDLLINIESSSKYRALNIANAASIILYNFYIMRKRSRRRPAPRVLRERAVIYFHNLSRVVAKDELYVERAARAFSNILNRSAPDTKEIRLILGILRRLNIYIENMGV